MKSLKVTLCGLLIAIACMLAATKASAQVTTRFYEFTGAGGFIIGVTACTQLAVAGNWTLRATPPPCPNSSVKLCSISITYTGTTHPSLQQILDALKAKCDADGGFTDGEIFTLNIPAAPPPVNVPCSFTTQLKP